MDGKRQHLVTRFLALPTVAFAVLASAPDALAASKQSPLVSVGIGLMIWTLIAFLITMLVLKKFFFPKIQAFIEKRRDAIQGRIDSAEQMKQEADQILAEYRQKLAEARKQADEIVDSARKAGETHQQEAIDAAKAKQEEMLEHTRKEIETETKVALERIRKEVADLTVLATEKVTRKSLNDDDHRRLVEEALSEVDFATIGASSNGSSK